MVTIAGKVSADLPAGGVHYHDWDEPLYPPQVTISHSQHGFRLARGVSGPTGLDVDVHWWHSGISSIKARVMYEVFEVDNTDCSLPGVLQDDA